MHFLGCHTTHPEDRTSVIDTRKFPQTGIYHVNDFRNAGFPVGYYAHEYLVHGVIQGGPGSGYSSVLWSDLVKLRIAEIMPHP
jgi:hypothetical protein